LEVGDPPASYRVEIGYLTAEGQFLAIARSNVVTTPKSGTVEALAVSLDDLHANADKIVALSGGYDPANDSREVREWIESRLQHTLGSPMRTRFGIGAEGIRPIRNQLGFTVDAEMVVFGAAAPASHVTIAGKPLPLKSDGSFLVCMPLPERRQVIPVVASSWDGSEEQTVILAIERNTKQLRRRLREPGE
jgi:hypothetical protein